jgi:hypothetical protein
MEGGGADRGGATLCTLSGRGVEKKRSSAASSLVASSWGLEIGS